MRFELEVSNTRRIRRRFDGIGERAADLRPAFRDVVDALLEGERRQFRTGEGWPRLAASTIARKRRAHVSPRAMRASGRLEHALTRRRAPGQKLEIRRDRLTFGLKAGRSPVFYGRFHQRGKGVPMRKVVVFRQQTRRRARRIVHDHVTGQ